MAKSNTGLYIGIVAAVVIVVAVIIGVAVANNNNGGGGETTGGGTSQETPREETGLTEDDLINVDEVVIVDYGEYEEMEEVAKAIQNGEMTGQVVQIDGDVSHPGTKYSIVETSEDGSKKIGTEFVIVDGDESDYPVDGSKVFIVGKVVEKEPMYFVIETLKDYVKVMQ